MKTIFVALLLMTSCRPGFAVNRCSWMDNYNGPVYNLSCDRMEDCTKLAIMACSAPGLSKEYKVVGHDTYGPYEINFQVQCPVGIVFGHP